MTSHPYVTQTNLNKSNQNRVDTFVVEQVFMFDRFEVF